MIDAQKEEKINQHGIMEGSEFILKVIEVQIDEKQVTDVTVEIRSDKQ